MDLDLRQAQRAFLSGDVNAGIGLLHRLLRAGRLEADQLVELLTSIFQASPHDDVRLKTNLLALAFQTQLLDDQAAEALMVGAYPEFRPPQGVGAPYLNVFLDRYPVASLSLWDYYVLRQAWPWLYQFYTTGTFESKSREIFDIALQEHITLPPKNILLTVSAEPPFNMETGRPIPPRNYDPYVSLYLVDSLDDVDEDEDAQSDESAEIPHWLNCYEMSQTYGGPEEGGWWRDVFSPQATLYMGYQEEYMPFDDRPEYIQNARDLLDDIYADQGSPVSIPLEDHSMQYHVYPEGGYE